MVGRRLAGTGRERGRAEHATTAFYGRSHPEVRPCAPRKPRPAETPSAPPPMLPVIPPPAGPSPRQALPSPSRALPSPARRRRCAWPGAALDYLNAAVGRQRRAAGNTPAAGNMPAGLAGAACGEVLIALGEIQAKLTAAHAGFLRAFDAGRRARRGRVRVLGVVAGRLGTGGDEEGRGGRGRAADAPAPRPAPAHRPGARRRRDQ